MLCKGMKTVLLTRHFTKFTGGHLKVSHYVDHILNSGFAEPRVLLTADSVRDESNVYLKHPDLVVDAPVAHDLLFLGGVDWPIAERFGLLRPDVPVINLLQATFHGNAEDPFRPKLGHFAVRITASDEVTAAIRATGLVNGPVHTITSAIDPLDHLRLAEAQRTIDVVVVGYKKPSLARLVGEQLAAAGIGVAILTDHTSQHHYFEQMRRARVTVMLPLEQEGSYIAALEAMALDVGVVCVAAPGVHSFCHHEQTALLTSRDPAALAEATLRLLRDDALSARLRANGLAMADKYSLERECAAFLPILARTLGVMDR